MKKNRRSLLATAIVVLLLIIGTGCGTTPTPTPTPTAPPVPDTSTPEPPPVNQPAVIAYDKVEGGSYIFVNDPEALRRENLADGPNRQSLYTGTISGETTMFLPHGNNTYDDAQGAIPIYYGAYFYNDSDTAATLTLLNNGASTGWIEHCEDWRKFYSFSGTGTDIKIAAHAGQWLFITKAVDDIDDDWGGPRSFTTEFDAEACQIKTLPFNGLLRVSNDAELEVRLLAFMDPATAKADAATLRETVYMDNQTGTTGISPYKNEVSGSFSWTIDDSTPSGRLPVSVNGNLTDRWSTNTTEHFNESVGSDALPFLIRHNGGTHMQAYGEIDPRTGKVWEFANWGVIYKNNFYITNNGSQPRVVAYCLSPYGVNQYISTYSPLTGYKDLPFSDVNNWLNGDQTVLEVVIQPGETKAIPVEYVLGGGSYWNIHQYLIVRDSIALEDDSSVVITQKAWLASEGYDSLPSYRVFIHNTSGLPMAEKAITLSGANADAFTVSKAQSTALAADEADVFEVQPVDGLPAGSYRAELSVGGSVLAVHLSVQRSDTYDYLTLVPADFYATGAETDTSRAQVAYGDANDEGVSALVVTNTNGNWPNAFGWVDWGSGLEIPAALWPYVYFEYDITVQKAANFTLVSGKNDRTNTIPLSWVMNENNTQSGGGIDQAYDMKPGHYAGRVTLHYLMNNRRTIDETLSPINLSSMFPLDTFYMDGWKIYAIGDAPATVTVSVFRLVFDTDAIG